MVEDGTQTDVIGSKQDGTQTDVIGSKVDSTQTERVGPGERSTQTELKTVKDDGAQTEEAATLPAAAPVAAKSLSGAGKKAAVRNFEAHFRLLPGSVDEETVDAHPIGLAGWRFVEPCEPDLASEATVKPYVPAGDGAGLESRDVAYYRRMDKLGGCIETVAGGMVQTHYPRGVWNDSPSAGKPDAWGKVPLP